MKVLLNRDIKNLGKVGELVVVKDGYGRNFLLPKKYAIVATKANIAKSQEKIEELKQINQQMIEKAKKIVDLLDNTIYNVTRQASDDDTMYGSVRTKDIFNFINNLIKKNNIDFDLEISGIKITEPIKSLGKYVVYVEIFGDISTNLRVNVCRTSVDFEEDIATFDKKREKNLTLLMDKNVNLETTEKKELTAQEQPQQQGISENSNKDDIENNDK